MRDGKLVAVILQLKETSHSGSDSICIEKKWYKLYSHMEVMNEAIGCCIDSAVCGVLFLRGEGRTGVFSRNQSPAAQLQSNPIPFPLVVLCVCCMHEMDCK